jgi:hypothetical protein
VSSRHPYNLESIGVAIGHQVAGQVAGRIDWLNADTSLPSRGRHGEGSPMGAETCLPIFGEKNERVGHVVSDEAHHTLARRRPMIGSGKGRWRMEIVIGLRRECAVSVGYICWPEGQAKHERQEPAPPRGMSPQGARF